MALGQNRVVPLTIASALFMEHLDSTIIATSLPAMARDLGVPPTHLNLAITSYLASMAVFIPASGWVADRFGARRVFITAICIFLAGSIACGAASDLLTLVAGRVLQGMGGAMMVPVGRLVMLRTVPRAELIGAMVWLSTPALIGPILGPPLGGFITTFGSWRWIFWVNVPIGMLGILVSFLHLPKLREENVPSFDTPGFLLSAIGLATLVLGLETAGRDIVSPRISALAGLFGVAALVLYVRHARSVSRPLVDIRLLDIVTYRLAIIGGSIFRLGVGAIPFLLPLQLQIGFGRSPLESGLTTFVGAVGSLFMKPVTNRILSRFGFRHALILNGAFAGLMIAVLGFISASTPVTILMVLLFVGGLCRSLEFTAINAVSYADLGPEVMSRATAFSSMAQQLSLSGGVAVSALILHLISSGEGVIDASHISVALFTIGTISALCCLVFLLLPRDAGADMIGREKA